jgi:two-component sensor histidine kinase/CheY-like chemotaxis protein
MKILHLEDSEDDAELICEALHREFVDCPVTRVQTRGAFIEAIDQPDWDVILADYSLPSFDGISALKLAVEKRPGLPFIFVSGSLGEELAIETLKNGASDYVLKSRLHRLPQAVARARREYEFAKAQKQAEQQLKESLHEKNLLLQEVHHRVKNNLAIISSLLDMQSNALDDPILAAALQESQGRIQSMSMIHEMLYASTSLHDIDFAEYARGLAAEVSNSYGMDSERIQLILELEPLRFEIDRAIPCGLILNELLTNAFKYAFRDGRSGEIRISLHLLDGSIRLAVEDTGVGLGEHSANHKSLGLNIVQILTRQLGATMVITSIQGSQFVLTIPQ